MLKVLAIVALLVSPALADKNKKKGDDARPPEAPAEQAPKKNKNKDKEEAPAAPPSSPPQADAPKNKNKDKKKEEAPPPAAPPPTEAPKGGLKPGQFAGKQICLGSTSGIGNIEVTSSRTVGVALCNGELRRVFLEKGICKGKAARTKVEYGWQFADTTGKDYVSCP